MILIVNHYHTYSYIKKFIDKKFLCNLISNISSYDTEERFVVKFIIYKLYGVSIYLRNNMINLFENILLDMTQEIEKPSSLIGIVEMLEITS